jgi:hypothetical protein
MIRDRLIPEIRVAFAGREMIVNPTGNPVVRFPAVQHETGDALIYDDGDEATVCVEHISHGHFNTYDDTLSQEQRDAIVTEDVIAFLRALFSDQVLLHVSPERHSGGWKRLDLCAGPIELMPEHRYYLWSRPYRAYQ